MCESRNAAQFGGPARAQRRRRRTGAATSHPRAIFRSISGRGKEILQILIDFLVAPGPFLELHRRIRLDSRKIVCCLVITLYHLLASLHLFREMKGTKESSSCIPIARVEKGDEIPITRAARSSTSLERIIKPLDSYEIKIVKSPASVHTVRPTPLSLSLSVRTANKSGSGSCVRLLRRLHLRRSTLLSYNGVPIEAGPGVRNKTRI